MGILKAEKPIFRKNDWAYAPFHPLVEGIQHTVCPYGTFNPVQLHGLSFSCVFNLFRHCHRYPFILSRLSTSTFLRPFAPRALPRFLATMNALTPARLVFLAFWMHNEPQPLFGQVSLLHAHNLPAILFPTTLRFPVSALYAPYYSQLDRLPVSRFRAFLIAGYHRQIRSGLHLYLAGSSKSPGRIGFVNLRTGRSPPVAPHPASRRRSYSRLQVVAST